MNDWVNTIGIIVQAASAVAVAVLTWRLIRVTRRYAETTDRYAETAERQLKESVLAREAGFQPYAHVESIYAGNLPDERVHIHDGIQVTVRNQGHGPAFGVRALLDAGQQVAASSADHLDLSPGSAGEIEFRTGVTSAASGHVHTARLWLEYRDLLGKKWATAVLIRFRVDGSTPTAAAVEDQTETPPTLIEKFFIQGNKLPSGDARIPWPSGWDSKGEASLG